MDNNFSQFARAGNPWVSERDRQEMAAAIPVRGGRRIAKPKPEFYEILEPTKISAVQIADAELREELRWLASYRGGTRTLAPHPKGPAHARTGFECFIKPPRDREMDPKYYNPKPEPIVTAEHQEALDDAKRKARAIADTRASIAALTEARRVAKVRLVKLEAAS